MRKYEQPIRDAVMHFWVLRSQQSTRQGTRGEKDRGSRSEVTGGKQMDGFVNLVRTLLLDACVPDASIATDSRIELPGWYRAEKKWDLLVVHDQRLIAAIEFKSQIGPSFGNNFNNRSEEAIGSATDLWAAYREGAFKPSARPWLGYVMLLEDCEAALSPVMVKEPHFQVFPEFRGASYERRYEVLIERLLRERLYDGGCFLTSRSADAHSGAFREPNEELTFERFIRSLLARVSNI